MHALIIEPQVFTSFMIEDALRDAGYTSVAMAVTEEEAIAAAEVEPPDLITAAVHLQEGSGIEAVKAIRAKHEAPVLFVTQSVRDVQEEAPQAPVVKKPFRREDLAQAIAEAQTQQG
ncbi:MAG: response regulator [Pseudomonadota bacterium]|nr:response regulator [Pseudomonadota bacterium]